MNINTESNNYSTRYVPNPYKESQQATKIQTDERPK